MTNLMFFVMEAPVVNDSIGREILFSLVVSCFILIVVVVWMVSWCYKRYVANRIVTDVVTHQPFQGQVGAASARPMVLRKLAPLKWVN